MDTTIYTGAELIALLQQEGKTYVETFGGPMPLATWHPYGRAAAAQCFVRNADGTATDAAILTARPGEYFGRWSFVGEPPCRDGRMIAMGTWTAVKNEKPRQSVWAIMIKRHYGAV